MIAAIRTSIKNKLIFIISATSAVAVLLACLVFYGVVDKSLRESRLRDLAGLAEIFGFNCRASLAFKIPEDAEEALAALASRPSIIFAEVKDDLGNSFASYGKTPGEKVNAQKISKPIMMAGDPIGEISLYDDMREFRGARKTAFILLLAVISAALGVALALASWLQGVISKPISQLVSAARRVSENRDYSVRATKESDDELGSLVDAFNDMLVQIERRDSALRESELRFRTLVEQAVDAFFLCGDDGRFIDVNRQACEDLGYERDELLSLFLSDIETGEGSGPEALGDWHKVAETSTSEVAFRRKDGSRFPAELKLGRLDLGGKTFVMCLARDITERRQLEQQFLQAQKMEAVGRLSGGIAHDFNNLLSAVLGYSELCILKLPEGNPIRKNIEMIYAAGEKAGNLTRQLLAFSRKQALEVRPANLNNIVNDIVDLLKRVIGEGVKLTITTEADVGNILADSSQIEQILMNLAVNARDAMPHGGSLTIKTASLEMSEDDVRNFAGMPPGRYVLLTVTDDGEGVGPEIKERIFEPFFTTKEKGKGTGLGLATIFGIVKQHKAFIYLDSEPGMGASFNIYFPEVRKEDFAAERKALKKDLRCLPRGAETLLVVDDDAAVRGFTIAALRPLGYALLEAESAQEALDLCASLEGNIDLLLTDVVMPGMNGRELAEILARNYPAMKIIFMSGYSNDEIGVDRLLKTGAQHLNKPLSVTELANRIRSMLDGSAD